MVRIMLSDPVVVSLAPKECDKWGQWQFPHLSHMQNGGIAMEYSVGQDSAGGASYRQVFSMDGGQTWTETGEFPSPNGVILRNGDAIRAMSVPAVQADGLRLPQPELSMLLDVVYYDFYKASRFPECFRGRWLQRYEKGEWKPECKAVESPDEYMVVTQDDLRHHPFGSPGKWVCPQRVDELTVAPNGEVWMAAYYHSDENPFPYYGVSFFVSTDNAQTFNLRSHVVYDDSFDPPAERRSRRWRKAEGFCEPALAFLRDGTVVCLMRSGSYNPSFIMRSADNGYTWSRPREFDSFGVFPGMAQLPNGAILAVYGRPGVRLRATDDPHAEKWSEPIDVISTQEEGYDLTCANSTILAIGEDTALLAYSHFHHPDGKGGYTKAVLVRQVKVEIR